MKDTECRKQIIAIESNLDLETEFRRDRDTSLQKGITSLNSRMSKTETDISLLNSQCDEHVNKRLTQLQCRIIDLEDAVKEQKTISHGRDNHIEEALGEVSKAGMYNYFKLHNQIDAITRCVTPKGNASKTTHNPLDNIKVSMGSSSTPIKESYPCYASSSELEKNALVKKLKCLGTVYIFNGGLSLKVSPENLIKVNIHEYVASCNYKVTMIGIHFDKKNISIDFRRNGE